MRVLVTLALVMAITLSPEISHGQDASSTENTKSKETNEKNLEKAKDKKNKPLNVVVMCMCLLCKY